MCGLSHRRHGAAVMLGEPAVAQIIGCESPVATQNKLALDFLRSIVTHVAATRSYLQIIISFIYLFATYKYTHVKRKTGRGPVSFTIVGRSRNRLTREIIQAEEIEKLS